MKRASTCIRTRIGTMNERSPSPPSEGGEGWGEVGTSIPGSWRGGHLLMHVYWDTRFMESTDALDQFSPLTPALSPLRGEGDVK